MTLQSSMPRPQRRRFRGFIAAIASASVIATGAMWTTAPSASAAEQTDVVYDSSFNSLPSETFWPGTEGWNATATAPNTITTADVPSTSDKSVRLSRTVSDGSGTILSRRFGTPLDGVVTVEASVMRPAGSANGFFGLPYIYNEAGTPVVSVVMAQGNLRAYQGTTLGTLSPYSTNQWYDLIVSVDLAAQRFDLTVDGVKVIDDGALRAPATGISRVDWYANGGELGVVHVDDVTITRTANYQPTTYYVSADGDDTSVGTDTSTAWRSLDKVNATTFKPGDTILLRAGDTWDGQLWPKGSGVAAHPITVDRYGDGAKPAIRGGGTVADAVRLHNQEYWTVRNLDVSNAAPETDTPGAHLGDFRGIGVHGDNGQILDDITIDAVDVHDVTGELNWIGTNGTPNSPGVNWGTGWDGSKNTGGIVFLTGVANPSSPGNPTTFAGATVQNSSVKNTSFGAITFKQYAGTGSGAVSTGWGTRRTANDLRFAPHTDVTIRGNYLTQAGTEWGANGIYLTNTRGGLVERNVVDKVGVSGIETYFADHVTVQYNEISGTKQKQGAADGNGLDPDIGTTNQLFQYNFLHDNQDGILLCGCNGTYAYGSAVVRYNVVVGSTRWNLHQSQSAGTVAEVYNNTFVSGPGTSNMITGPNSGTISFRNNIFASPTANMGFAQSSRITYDNNAYTPNLTGVPASDTRAVKADPLFANPSVTGPYGTQESGPQLDTARAYALQAGSLLINAAADVAGRGDRDFIGAPVPTGGAADIGALEYATPEGQLTETVSGVIRNQLGETIEGAQVTITAGGQELTGTSDPAGFYRISEVPFDDEAEVRVSAVNHDDATATVTVAAGSSTRRDIELTNNETDATLNGVVVTEQGTPVPGATVTLTNGDSTIATAQSGPDGRFSLVDVAPGSGYTATASTTDRPGIPRAGIDAQVGTRDIGGLYIDSAYDEQLLAEPFDGLPTGTLADGTNGLKTTTTGTNNAVEVVELPSAEDKSARLTRVNTASGPDGTSVQKIFETPLQGLVKIEADVMRASGGGFFGVPYVYAADGRQAISVATQNGNFLAYEGTTSRTIKQYTTGTWYRLAITVDTVNQRYSLDIDGERLISDATFRNPLPGVARITWYANGNETGIVHVDDLLVSRGIDSVAPAVVNDTAETTSGTPVTVDVLSNDGTAPALDPQSLTLLNGAGEAVSSVSNEAGTFEVSEAKIVFTPAAGFTGTSPAVSYRVANVTGASASATIIVTVTPGAATLPVTVTSRCIAAKSTLTVQLDNTGDVPVDVEISTAYGTKTLVAVAPGKSAFHAFTTRLKTMPAGEVTVKTTRVVGNGPLVQEQQVAYEGRTC